MSSVKDKEKITHSKSRYDGMNGDQPSDKKMNPKVLILLPVHSAKL